jgi:diadenosine tetraphosphate (Ap4A) HIT family hydrolase
MSPAALASLGPTIATVTRAIEAVVQPQRVYCTSFSEQTHSIHFHLFPRTERLTAEYLAAHPHRTEISGPLLLDWARKAFRPPTFLAERNDTLQKIAEHLSAA